MNILKLLTRRKVLPPREINPARIEITLSGSGGQGMILAGKILAEAAAIYDGKEAVMAQSYGPEARGGASRAEVIIGTEKINYPKVMRMDILLAMTQEAVDKYGKLLREEGLLIVDETLVKSLPANSKNVFKASFSAMAVNKLHAQIVANIIALGALAAITGIVSRDSLIKAVLARVPEKVIVLDRLAVDMGFKIVKDSAFVWKTPEVK